MAQLSGRVPELDHPRRLVQAGTALRQGREAVPRTQFDGFGFSGICFRNYMCHGQKTLLLGVGGDGHGPP